MRERSGADGFPAIKTEFEGVPALHPVHVIRNLIRVLDGELRRISIRPDIQVQIVHNDIGELVQSREFEIARGRRVVKAVVAQAELIRQIWSEVMILG